MKKFIIYVIAITVAFSFIRFESSAANKSSAADGYYQLYIDLTSEDNLFLSTYDMNVKFAEAEAKHAETEQILKLKQVELEKQKYEDKQRQKKTRAKIRWGLLVVALSLYY